MTADQALSSYIHDILCALLSAGKEYVDAVHEVIGGEAA